MSFSYPVVLDLTDRRCLVVGGGPVAEGRVEALLAAGARLTVVSPTLTPRLGALAQAGRIRHVARGYRRADVAGHHLVVVATDDRAVTEAVAREGRERGIWVNAADCPGCCDFILPSVLRRGRLTVAVSTGGATPALARAIREELEARVTPDYAALVEVVAEVRRELRQRAVRPAAQAWRGAVDRDLRALVAEGRHAEARARLRRCLGTA